MDSRAIRPREGGKNHIHGGRGLDGGNEGAGTFQVSGLEMPSWSAKQKLLGRVKEPHRDFRGYSWVSPRQHTGPGEPLNGFYKWYCYKMKSDEGVNSGNGEGKYSD